MRIIAEQYLPTDFGTLRKFIDKTNDLVESDTNAAVSYYDGALRVCTTTEFP